ncbi:MAG: phosphatase PAP2 family protein [Bacteroidetes bacterium]|nr:phosphatase PAP2 family protein [Bacteroidota bacterium]
MKKLILLITVSFFCVTANAQVPQQPADTLIKKLDSLEKKTDSLGFQNNNIKENAYNETTRLRTRDYFILLGSNIKQQFTKPFHMRKKDWINLGKFATVAVSVGIFDERIQKNAVSLRNNSGLVRNTGKYISLSGGTNEVFTLAAFGLYGVITKNEKVKTTTLLATQAVITATLVETVVKVISGRRRPNFYGDNEEAEPKFTGPFGNVSHGPSGRRTNSSFPSGHTTVAFAVSTVFAVEYRDKPVIPIIAYSMATLMGVSRITENKHWASDVLVGAALGYITGKQVAFNYHRLAKIKNQQKAAKRSISFGFHLTDWGAIQPGLTWKL